MKSLHAFLKLLGAAPRGWTAGLMVLMLVSSLTEGIGLLLLVPMLGLLGGGQGGGNPVVRHVLEVLKAGGLPVSLISLLAVFLLLVSFRSAIQYGRERLGASLQHLVVDELRLRCFEALLGAEWRWIVAGRKQDHANLLLTDVSRTGVGFNFALSLAAGLASAIAYLAVAMLLSWPMTLLALASGGLVFWLLAGQRRAAFQLGRKLGEASRNLHGNVQESLAGIKLTKILGMEARHLERFRQTTGGLKQEQLSFLKSNSGSRALFQVGGAFLLAGYLYAGLSFWNMPLPSLLVLVMLFARLVPLFMTLHQNYHQWLHAMPALYEIDALLESCEISAEPASDSGEGRMNVREMISLDDVTVRYPGRELPALEKVSLQFPARTTTAITGPSGAGKSTLADILIGLLVPDEGELRVDGEPVSGSRRKDWRREVAYVPQDVFLFHDSIRNNLLWAAPGATEEELKIALQNAAADFVFGLPQGLDTVVGDEGLRLSGGERQRIALARALLNHPAMLILDEATSALDLDNEARVRQAIEKLHGDLTVVIIGHRLATLEQADKVVVLEKGHVAAQGSWQDVSGGR